MPICPKNVIVQNCERNPEPISIATVQDRAWQRFRVAILKNLDDPNDTLRPVIEDLKERYLRACGL